MAKKTIAIDVDDVLAEHVPAFIAFSNKMFGTKLTVEDYSDHWSQMWQVDIAERERRAKAFQTPENIKDFDPILGADEVLRRLARKYNLALVTARPPKHMQVTIDWLKIHYPEINFDMHFIALWEDDKAPSKSEVCKRIGAEYLIDDLPSHCNIAAEGGIKALLFGDYAWNRNEEIRDGIVRVRDWRAVLEFFENEG